MSGTLYELVGGRAWFEGLVDRFYEGVADDEVLRPLYPEEDLTGARERLTGFLVQYWGGPHHLQRRSGATPGCACATSPSPWGGRA